MKQATEKEYDQEKETFVFGARNTTVQALPKTRMNTVSKSQMKPPEPGCSVTSEVKPSMSKAAGVEDSRKFNMPYSVLDMLQIELLNNRWLYPEQKDNAICSKAPVQKNHEAAYKNPNISGKEPLQSFIYQNTPLLLPDI